MNGSRPWERPLPLGLVPQPGEALAGYLLALADRLGISPTDLAVRTGLTPTAAKPVPPEYALAVPDDACARFAAATRTTPEQVRRLTLTGYDRRLFRLTPDSDAPVLPGDTDLIRSWSTLTARRACPGCLTDSADTDGAAWRLAWQTPWAIACTRHRCLLIDTCPACTVPLGDGGGSGLILRPGLTLPVDACRAIPAAATADSTGKRRGVCGQPLRHAAASPLGTVPASLRVLAAQRHLDAILEAADRPGDMPGFQTLGMPVSADQHLRDVRLLAQVLDMTGQAQPGLPDTVTAAYAARARARATQSRHGFRYWAAPPDTALLAAALIVPTVELLTQPVADAAEAVDRIAAAARAQQRLTYNRLRFGGAPSTRLRGLLSDATQRRFTATALRAADDTGNGPPPLDPNRIPAFLPEQDRLRHFDWHAGPAKSLRRAVPLLAHRLVTGGTLNDAADHLGIPRPAAAMAVARAGRAVAAPGDDHRLRQAVLALAAEWGARTDLPDYAHRRAALTGYRLDEQTWDRLSRPHREQEARRSGGRRADWDSRRTAASAHIWAEVTGGEIAYSPEAMALRGDGQAITAHSERLRRATELLADLAGHAAELTATIDGGRPLVAP